MKYINSFMVVSRGHISMQPTQAKALKHASSLEQLGYLVKVYQQIVLCDTEAYILIYSTEIIKGG